MMGEAKTKDARGCSVETGILYGIRRLAALLWAEAGPANHAKHALTNETGGIKENALTRLFIKKIMGEFTVDVKDVELDSIVWPDRPQMWEVKVLMKSCGKNITTLHDACAEDKETLKKLSVVYDRCKGHAVIETMKDESSKDPPFSGMGSKVTQSMRDAIVDSKVVGMATAVGVKDIVRRIIVLRADVKAMEDEIDYWYRQHRILSDISNAEAIEIKGSQGGR
jgi:hypothetical protein